MPRLSLTDLVDVFSKSGRARATKVSQIKNRDSYNPAQDFYKAFRDGVVSIHRRGGNKSELKTILVGLTDPKKIGHYPKMTSGYGKWWGKKNLNWFNPTSDVYSFSGVDVSINPELGLEIGGERFVIKLYMKDDALKKDKADLVVGLMRDVLGEVGVKYAVLDVKRSKLFTENAKSVGLKGIVDAELSFVATIWPTL